MVERKLVSFAAIVALWTLVTLLIKIIRIHLKWKWIQDKNYAIFTAMLRRKRFCPGNPEWSVHMGKFSSQLPRSRS